MADDVGDSISAEVTQPPLGGKPGACSLNIRRGLTDASRAPRVPETATKLSRSPSGKSPAATRDTQSERLAELSGGGLTCAPRGAAGNSGFARSTSGCMVECAAGVKKRADAVTNRWKQIIPANRMDSINDLKGGLLELEPNCQQNQ